MQFTLHATRRRTPHGASRLVQAMSAWLAKTRRAPSRHSRDARVNGHTTTAMRKLSTEYTLLYLGMVLKTEAVVRGVPVLCALPGLSHSPLARVILHLIKKRSTFFGDFFNATQRFPFHCRVHVLLSKQHDSLDEPLNNWKPVFGDKLLVVLV